ncbi:MAG TPA: hypothetical protein VF821_20970 [Lentzea sp.]
MVQAELFDDVLAELAERKTEFREQRYVPRDFVARLKETGIYRAAAPARFGGEPLPPAGFLDLVERGVEVPRSGRSSAAAGEGTRA